MNRLSLQLFVFVLAAAISVASGCSDSVEQTTFEPIDSSYQSTDAVTTLPNDVVGPEPGAGPVFTFVNDNGQPAVGDDGVACVPGNGCVLQASVNSSRNLSVLYTVDGLPIENVLVSFEKTDDTSGQASLVAGAVYTGPNGIATGKLKTGDAQGDVQIKASINSDVVSPLFFEVIASSKVNDTLTISATYSGPRPVSYFQTYLYEQNDDSTPNCDDIESLFNLGQASLMSPVKKLVPVPETFKIKTSDMGLAEGEQRHYTVIAVGVEANPETDPILAWGCDNLNATLPPTGAGNVEIELIDRPPSYAGTYNLTSHFNFLSALPDDVEQIVGFVFDFFKSPTGGLLSLACTVDGSALDGLCDLVFSDPDSPDIENPTPQGGLIIDILDALISGFTQDTVFGTVFTTGKDISNIITDFEIHGTITFDVEPGPDLMWTSDETEDTWDYITVQWTLDANCDPVTDPGCGNKNFSFAAIQPDDPVIVGNFEASVQNFYELVISPHPLNVQYGALINAVLEKVLFPIAFGEGNPEYPVVVDSYEKALKALIGGGSECLHPNYPQTCCAKFAEQVAGGGGGQATLNVLNNTCDGLVTLGADYLSSYVSSLDANTGDNFMIGTEENHTCWLVDADSDMVIDGIGGKENDMLCKWNVTISLLGLDMVIDDATFWAARAD
jgi:hypothetical protein